MDFKIEGNGDTITLKVIGDVTAESSPELRETILDLGKKKPKTVVLDLGGMSFIDTSGLGVLVGVRSNLKKNGTGLELINPQPRVMQVLRLTQLSKIFGIE